MRKSWVFLSLILIYFLSNFYRSSTSVITPNLLKDLSIGAEKLGLLTATFFYVFALAQIPMGPLLDRVGPRIIMCGLCLIAGLGSVLFGISENYRFSLLGRALMGLGMSCALIGALKILTIRFKRNLFGTLSGLLMALGVTGSIAATSPLAILVSSIGWRLSFIYIGVITVLFSVTLFFILENRYAFRESGKDQKMSKPSKNITLISEDLKKVLCNRNFWSLSFVIFCWHGSYAGIQGLWLAPYLMNIFGLPPVVAGNLVMLIPLGFMVGGPILGRLSDKTFCSRKKLVIPAFIVYAAAMVPLMGFAIPNKGEYLIFPLFLFGFSGALGVLLFAHVKELFPSKLSGTSMSFLNFFSLVGAAAFQHSMGFLIQNYYNIFSQRAYHLSFGMCFIGVIASCLVYLFVEEGNIQHSEKEALN